MDAKLTLALIPFLLIGFIDIKAQNSCPDPDDFITTCMDGTGTCDGITPGECTFSTEFSTEFSGNNKYVDIDLFSNGIQVLDTCIGPLPQNTLSYTVMYTAPCGEPIVGTYRAYTNSSSQNPCGGTLCEVGFCQGDTCQEGILPIVLVSFNASLENNHIALQWTTAQEFNNEYFRIDRSTDGLRWQELGRLTGRGNSNVEQHYTFMDNAPLPMANYYRLAQVDFDGSVHYSSVVSIDKMDDIGTLDMYYSTKEQAFIIPTPRSTSFSAYIVNAQGQLVLFVEDIGNARIDVSGFLPGIYFADIRFEGHVFRRSFVVP